ncbi:MAG: hypothetical protein QXW98_04115 [Candidatus Caldarchaeum sp.]
MSIENYHSFVACRCVERILQKELNVGVSNVGVGDIKDDKSDESVMFVLRHLDSNIDTDKQNITPSRTPNETQQIANDVSGRRGILWYLCYVICFVWYFMVYFVDYLANGSLPKD